MSETKPSDPGIVMVSTAVYRLLLWFYPARFRREYGGQMMQVFRDGCLKTFRNSGTSGMLVLWAHTLFDWFKTVIEEQINRRTEMTRQKFIRLSGWGMILATIALTFVFLVASGPILQEWMVRYTGISASVEGFKLYRTIKDNLDSANEWLGFAGLFLFGVGIIGLHLQYGKQVGRFGKTSLLFSMVSGGITVLGIIGFSNTFLEGIFKLGYHELYIFIVDLCFRLYWYGAIAIFVFLTLFGVATLRTKPMSRWNGLPLLSGFGITWTLVGVGPFSLRMGLTLMALVSFLLLGYVLQEDARQDEESLSFQAT
ncbi:MAG TPA: hypothetical protein PK530_14285 [Anaerolineales bacterium]|nr:hypothetical protein [Anaerolineales bacterium]